MPKTKKSQARKGRGKASGSPRSGRRGDADHGWVPKIVGSLKGARVASPGSTHGAVEADPVKDALIRSATREMWRFPTEDLAALLPVFIEHRVRIEKD